MNKRRRLDKNSMIIRVLLNVEQIEDERVNETCLQSIEFALRLGLNLINDFEERTIYEPRLREGLSVVEDIFKSRYETGLWSASKEQCDILRECVQVSCSALEKTHYGRLNRVAYRTKSSLNNDPKYGINYQI